MITAANKETLCPGGGGEETTSCSDLVFFQAGDEASRQRDSGAIGVARGNHHHLGFIKEICRFKRHRIFLLDGERM